MNAKPEYGLLIDYEYCTGCYACQVACAQEYKWPAGTGGIRVMEIVEKLTENKNYLKFMPIPTELCILCKGRTAKGKKPACVQHCMAACMEYGKIEELIKKITKPRMVLWVPKR